MGEKARGLSQKNEICERFVQFAQARSKTWGKRGFFEEF